jgi:DNA-3-methyladenine glycosylase II
MSTHGIGDPGRTLALGRKHLRNDPTIGLLISKYPDFDPRAWLSDLPKMDAFGTLVFQVIGQQLSLAATRKILARLQMLFGDKVPTARQLLATTPARLRRVGLSKKKAATLRTLAKRFLSERLTLGKIRKLTDEQILALLTSVPGIGPWTVEGFLIIALDRPDVVLPGDLALRKTIKRVYKLEALPSEAQVLELSQSWRPYRSLATAYLFQSAFERPPKAATD